MKKIFISILKKSLHFFWRLHAPLVRKNIQYKDIHKGETCLIFGNGGSLKYFDFDALPKIPAIGCNFSPIDNRMKKLDFRYWVVPDSYPFLSFYYHMHTNSFRKNFFTTKGRRLFTDNSDKIIFTSITGLYGNKKGFGKIVYFNHYGDKTTPSYDLAGNFAVSHGSLHAMIGIAKYLGFAKAIVLGCDYLGTPKLQKHFYSDAAPYTEADDLEYVQSVKAVADGIEILVIFPKSKSMTCPVFASASFEDYFGSKEIYHENFEIIDPYFLNLMREAASDGILYM